MIERLGSTAARHKMYLVVCSDLTESDGGTYNTAFLLGRDGKEIGRYHKVCPAWSEAGVRQRGRSFPVFPTPDLGTAGMLICYDLVVPETARCLALAGADIIFFPTMGGAAIGDDDIGVQALRVRAAENFIWLVIAQRGSGAMIISPQGKIVATAEGPDGLVAVRPRPVPLLQRRPLHLQLSEALSRRRRLPVARRRALPDRLPRPAGRNAPARQAPKSSA